MKKCSKCKTEKPLDDFYPDKRYSDGRQSYCKGCLSNYRDARRAKARKQNDHRRPAKAKAEPGSLKTCAKCFLTFPVEKFYSGHGYADGYTLNCRKCHIMLGVARCKKRSQDQAGAYFPTPTAKKTCTKCGVEKQHSQFVVDRSLKTMTGSHCRKCTSEYSKKWKRSDPARNIIQGARPSAKRRGLEFAITVDDITPLPEVCPVLGIKLRQAEGQRQDDSYSIDRTDSSKGYIPGNVRIMSWRANCLKKDGTVDEIRALLVYMEGLGRPA